MPRLTFILLCCLTAPAFADDPVIWRTPVTYNTNGLEATTCHLDAAGNVYVVGTADQDASKVNGPIVITKLSPTGTPLWAAAFAGSMGNDAAIGAALDGAGNIYVLGNTATANGSDTVLLKYTSGGVPQWTNRVANFSARAIALDNATNLYITGSISNDAGFAKYNAAGQLLWNGRFDSATHDYDYPVGMAVDTTTGAMYLSVASVATNYSYSRPVFLKVVNGAAQWVRYNETNPSWAYGRLGVAVSQDAGIYFSGYSSGRMALWKYDSSGTLVWSSRYSGVGGATFNHAMVVDTFGNVTLCTSPVVAHFSRAGIVEWSTWISELDSYSSPVFLGIDSTQTPFLRSAVSATHYLPTNLWLIRFEPNGSARWRHVTSFAGGYSYCGAFVSSNGVCVAADLKFDSFQRTTNWVSKISTNAGSLGPQITSLSTGRVVFFGTPMTLTVAAAGSGPLRYQWQLNGEAIPNATNQTFAFSASLSSAGSYSVAVTDDSGTTLSPEITVPVYAAADKYASIGTSASLALNYANAHPTAVRWRFGSSLVATGFSLTISNVSPANAGPYTVEVDDWIGSATGRVFLVLSETLITEWTVKIEDVAPQSMPALAYDRSGVINVVHIYDNPAAHAYDTNGALLGTVPHSYSTWSPATRIATDDSGRVYVQMDGWWQFSTLQYAARAQGVNWTQYAYPNVRYPYAAALVVDNDGNAYSFGGGVGEHDFPGSGVLAVRHNGTNTTQVYQSYVDHLADIHARAMALTSSNDLYLLWYWGDDQFTQRTNFIVRVGRDGTAKWTRTFIAPGEKVEFQFARVDSLGNLYAAGSTGPQHTYIATKWSPTGALLWARRFYSSSYMPAPYSGGSAASAATVDSQGNLILTGGGGTVKYSPEGLLLWSSPLKADVLTVDEHDNVYVGGGWRKADDVTDAYAAKLKPNGLLSWHWVHPTTGSNDVTSGIAVEKDGVVYVCGRAWSLTFLTKLSERTATPALLTNNLAATAVVAPGSTLSLVAPVALTAPPRSYRWYFDGVLLANQTNHTLNVTVTSSGQLGGYSVEVISATNSGLSAETWVTMPTRLSLQRTAGASIVSFQTDWRYEYRLQASGSLTQWTERASAVFSNGPARLQVTDTNGANAYRVVIQR